MTALQIRAGYLPGLIGRVAELHAVYYAQHWSFERYFEAKVATELAAFLDRYDASVDCIWSLHQAGRIEASLTIDGSDEAPGTAHLRWFITSDALRGRGAGNQLMSQAMAFCTERRFERVYLWTFRGLHAARHLYDKHGFILVEERVGKAWGTAVTEQRFEAPVGAGC